MSRFSPLVVFLFTLMVIVLALSVSCDSKSRTNVTPGTTSAKSNDFNKRPSSSEKVTTTYSSPVGMVQPGSTETPPTSMGSPLVGWNKSPDGSVVFWTQTVEKMHDGGTYTREEAAEGKGAGLSASGDKIDSDFEGSAPGVTLPGGSKATGGGSESSQKIIGLEGTSVWKNPLFWLGVVLLVASGVCVYLRITRAAIISGVTGVGMIATAFYPFLMLFIIIGAIVIFAWPLIQTEIEKIRSTEALRATVAGVNDLKSSNSTAYETVKGFISKHAEKNGIVNDEAVIKAVKRSDEIG